MSSYNGRSSFHSQSYSPLQKRAKERENELEPYSTLAIEELLQSSRDWRNIQDIIRVTFKSITDAVRLQGEAIRDLEKTIATKASRNELNSSLTTKANTSEVSRLHGEFYQKFEERPCFHDLQNILKDHITKNDVQYLLSSKISLEETQSLIKNKANSSEINSEFRVLHKRIEELQTEIVQKMGNQNNQQLEEILVKLDQKANLVDMNIALEGKANKASVQQALHRKANKGDQPQVLEKDIKELLLLIREKADISTVDNLGQIMENKINKSDFTQLWNEVQKKLDKLDLQSIENKMNQNRLEFEDRLTSNVELIQSDIKMMHESVCEQLSYRDKLQEQINEMKNEVQDKLSIDELQSINNILRTEVSSALDSIKKEISQEEKSNQKENVVVFELIQEELKKQEIQEQVKPQTDKFDSLKRHLDDQINRKIEKKDLTDLKKYINSQIEDKATINEVQEALNICQVDLTNRIMELKQASKTHMQQIENKLKNTVSADEINSILSQKPDLDFIQQYMEQKLSSSNQNMHHSSKIVLEKEMEYIKQDINNLKVKTLELENNDNQQKQQQDMIVKEIFLKASMKDMITLLDGKTSIDDTNKALSELSYMIEMKANQEDLNNVVGNQAIINESLCTENIVGRWSWKSGNLTSGNLVPWESQLVNTLPDNFIWEKEKCNVIVTIAPGLYQVAYGFFCNKRPNIQLCVNGQPAIVCQDSKQEYKENIYSEGNITGTTLSEYLVLPGKAAISVVYEGEDDADGFFELKRL